MKQNPLFLAGGFFATLVAPVVLYLVVSSYGGSGALTAAHPPETEEDDSKALPCSNGQQVEAGVREEGDGFKLTGELQSFNDDVFLVKTPDGDIDVGLATDAEFAGQLLSGDWLTVEGSMVDGKLMATALKQPCSEAPLGPAPPRVETNVSGGTADGPTATRASGPPPPAAPTQPPEATAPPVSQDPPAVEPTPPPPEPTPEPTASPEPTAEPTPVVTPTPQS